ncbi:ABC-F family ATP-binding cassette domain-containing protein [Solimonas terrae]|uniref:ABC-F family ATP-binding cassette domain-containing protein n=1 Tax=Solimonas terrae TaxID=1396819 RepID=A0A6M2BQX3_9GAMM|nr:ATP-binding cassette domain-containing protein [Solimonas terrae]NGY04996.1 ABC-F family ATP-binding cassette domain-containing protein [Solimonas terrae]
MTNPISLTLHGVSWQLPDGSFLFSELDATFDARHTGLVGRNGVGKSVLARILAAEVTPTGGRCARIGRLHYLPQQITPRAGETVADLAGVRGALDALHRIEAGSTLQADFDAVGDRWQLSAQLQQALSAMQLGHLQADSAAMHLSGGEAMRVALAGALVSDADWLILDEPTNHLDARHRRDLITQLQRRSGGLIVVSHDRLLLESMARIVELSDLGLRSHGGGYSFYAERKAHERAVAIEQLERRKTDRRRQTRALTRQRERLEQRQSRGTRQAAQANQAPILLGLQKQRAENSAGRLRVEQAAARATLSQGVRDAAAQVEDDPAIVLLAPGAAPTMPERVASLREVLLPNVRGRAQRIDLRLSGAQRVGLLGANGSGKSTLLKVLAGLSEPLSGVRELAVETAYLDQRLSTLDPARSTLEQMLAANPSADESTVRTQLALLGQNAARVPLPTERLSGGERIKAALAMALYAERPARLLLLDEPDNHLDLASVQALETMLRQYRGALIVVSHDTAFLANIELTHRLQASERGWLLTAWS